MAVQKTPKILLPEDTQKPEQLRKAMHSPEGKLADAITAFAGSMNFVYLHVLWFSFWILMGSGLLEPFIPTFDPFPYGLLTMLVSLEAIFLSTFIMISQNRQALLDTYREQEEDKEQAEEDKEQEALEHDVEEIGQDVEEIGQDVEEVGQDVQELGKDVDEMQKDLDEIRSAVLLIQQKLTNVEKSRSAGTGKSK